MKKHEKAAQLFSEGLNCSQSVFSVFSEELGMAEKDAVRVALAFGGGMGRMQETCGAVTGALMAIGLKCAKPELSRADMKRDAYAMTQEFAKRFKEIHGTIGCRELLGVDLSTKEGDDTAKRENLFNTLCPRYIIDAVKILEEMK